MSGTTLIIFEAFYNALASVEGTPTEAISAFGEKLQSELDRLDPIATDALIKSKLGDIQLDIELLNLYDDIKAFQYEHTGEFYRLDKHHPLAVTTIEVARRMSGEDKPAAVFLPKLMAALDSALTDRAKVRILQHQEQRNAKNLQEYRVKKLEENSRNAQLHSDTTVEVKSSGEFTHTQQAIAIHYLFIEALGISGVDNTKLMEFAHLLSAKKIPINKETGKENIRNSGIKSAFNKAWKKEDANHLADLRFVLRFFKPLYVEGTTGIQNAVAALEKRIAKISEKLNREKD